MNDFRKLTIAMLFTLMGVAGFAQSPVHFGPKAGLNYSKIRFTEGSNRPDGQYYTGFHAGVFGRLDLGRLYLQPEVVYNEKGTRLQTATTTNNTSSDVRLKTLDIPVMLGVKLVDAKVANVRMMGGPVFSNILEERSEALQRITEKNFSFNKQNVGYQVGLGVDVATFTVDVRYESSLQNISSEFGSRPDIFQISLGFKIL
jgi:hypothetical protein